MKKIEILNKKMAAANAAVQAVSFERKDTSYRRSGGYYGTNKADLSGVIVVKSFDRTKYLTTYVCVDPINELLVTDLKAAEKLVNEEQIRMRKIAIKRWHKDSIQAAIDYVNKDIDNGTIYTNYGKRFFVGNENIYYCHPEHGHSDYNKWRAMPNTPAHRKLAEELNLKIELAIKAKEAA